MSEALSIDEVERPTATRGNDLVVEVEGTGQCQTASEGRSAGRYAELREPVALVERGDVELRTERHDLDEINAVAERLEHGEIERRAVIVPP